MVKVQPDKTIGILIVEDQDVVRIGLNLSLEDYQEIEILSEVTDGVEAVIEAVALKPDVILMDIGLPRMDGIAAATLIKKELNTRIIMFTDHDDDQSVFAAMSAGAEGYCLKDVTAEQLVKAIKTVAEGSIWLDERVAGRVLNSYNAPGAPPVGAAAPSQEPAAPISAGYTMEIAAESTFIPSSAGIAAGTTAPAEDSAVQMNVLSLMVEGRDAEYIARKLGMTVEAVNGCLHSTMDRLSKSDRAQAALADLRREMFKDVPGLSLWCPHCQRDLDPSFQVCPFDGTSLGKTSEEQLVGKTFADRYEIIEMLGKGAMGIVYKARHKFMNRLVAIKIMHPHLLDINNMKRFRQEAEAASALQHANVIHIYDFGLTTTGEAFLVMDYLQGIGLDDVLRADGRVPVERALNIFIQCCDALDHAHSKGVVHRDLKPSNIVLVTEPDHSESIRIVDFGIAKLNTADSQAAPGLTQEGVIQGSPSYMSPEQCQGKPIDGRSDIYSFATLMYETLCGRVPFVSDNAFDAMYMQVRGVPEPLNKTFPDLKVPPALDDAIIRALAKEPAQRQTAKELKQELVAVQAHCR